MLARLALILVAAAGTMAFAAPARAADLRGDFGGGSAFCDCGSDMITVYDYEPGVITRQWKTDCGCGEQAVRRPRIVVAPATMPNYEPIVDPWRRH